MSKMFPGVKTWSPATGCTHACPYCSAEKRTLPRVRHNQKYASGFKPSLDITALHDGPPKAETVFVTYMGDLFCNGFTFEEIDAVITRCMVTPVKRVKNFLLMTKNPARYFELLEKCPDVIHDGRFIFGSTIETNLDNFRSLSRIAPRPTARLNALTELRIIYKQPRIRIAVSMEPVMDFDPETMGFRLAEQIKPEIIWIGYDGYNYVPGDNEPSRDKVLNFIANLRSRGLNVVEKTIRERKGV